MNNSPPYPLQTTRCHLTALREQDREHIVLLRTNEKVRRFLGGPPDKASIASHFAKMLTPEASTHHWAVRLKTNDTFIGLITLDPHHNGLDIEISYELLPTFWGKGYATETVKKVIDFAFHKLKLPRVVAETQMANTPSRRLLERLGMAHEQTIKRFGAQQAIYVINLKAVKKLELEEV